MMFLKIVSYRHVGEVEIKVHIECCDVDDGKLPEYFDSWMSEICDITQVTVGLKDMHKGHETIFFKMLFQIFAAIDGGWSELGGHASWTLNRIFEKVLNVHIPPKP